MCVPQQKQCRLLLVDDHADTREVLGRLLSDRFEIATAGCFATALAAAEEQTPDVVVTDIGLPGGRDGVALMRALRDRFGVPGIAVTGHAIDDKATLLRDAGFINWLRKPIRFEELLTALDDACAELAEPRPAA